jgi:hypothetical protein
MAGYQDRIGDAANPPMPPATQVFSQRIAEGRCRRRLAKRQAFLERRAILIACSFSMAGPGLRDREGMGPERPHWWLIVDSLDL